MFLASIMRNWILLGKRIARIQRMLRRARRKKRMTKRVNTEVQERASMTQTQITIMTLKRRRVLAMIQKMVQRLIMMRRRKRNTRNLVLVQMMILKMIGRKPSVERILVMILSLIRIVAMARRKPNMQRMIKVKERRYQ